ncbi:sulfurtransferase [Aliterella atlantica]|uniref:3-mercaptopyruvate sulfurtransferase n=1 Tax=Aliterella atlantica CENA595 TaxID=1618023 RepID=A0A0D8ZUY3_9CYAN|nr:sulfurtransferase [Aliterella atlantica]KJH72593.1 3-mercaptopyruvate sulfurtransferase [Aliterella atlantica CENA595]
MDNLPVVSASWLYEHIGEEKIAIADCRFSLANPQLGQQQYQLSHIPGAHYLDLNSDLSSPVQKHGGRHPLPDFNQLAAKLSAMGVDSQTLVVAYDDSRFAFAARLWWLLRYMGHKRVAVLDGGFKAWQVQGYPISDEVPQSQPAKFDWQLQPAYAVDIDIVKARKDLPNVALVDARESDRYRGISEPIDPVAGHILGAVNYPWQDVSTPDGYLRPQSAQSDRWQELKGAEEIIVYCGSGVTACVDLLSLQLAGINTGKLYVGSWSDWCSYS